MADPSEWQPFGMADPNQSGTSCSVCSNNAETVAVQDVINTHFAAHNRTDFLISYLYNIM